MCDAIRQQHKDKGFPPPFELSMTTMHIAVNLWDSNEFIKHLSNVALVEAHYADLQLYQHARNTMMLGVPPRSMEEQEARRRDLEKAMEYSRQMV